MKLKKLAITTGEILLSISLCLGMVYFAFPEKTTKTVLYFPNYNPLAPAQTPSLITQKIDPESIQKPADQSKLVTVQLDFSDHEKRNLIIYIPPKYQPEQGNKYPLLILLHGSPGKETDWIEAAKAKETLDNAINSGMLSPAIVAFPDGNGNMNNDTQYINSTDGKELNADFITKKVIGYVSQNFAIKPESKYHAIGGLSSGGFGAINLGLKNQDVFGEILSFSGYGNIEVSESTQKLIQHSDETIKSNSPLKYIKNLTTNTIKIKLVVGKQDGFLSENQEIQKQLKDKNFQVDFSTPDGVHSWIFWTDQLKNNLEWLNQQWK
jgi:enterochelin esterase-like enzyme